ncbi:MAG: hypothetical protein QM796_21740 [Chthoniobacteraceae bacterium]
MKTLIKSAIVSLIAVTLGLGTPALHAQAPAASATPAAAAAKEKHPPFHGVVSGVDANAKTFTLTSKAGNVRTFTVGSGATVLNGDAAATFADIKVGSYVRGTATKTAKNAYEVTKVILGAKEAKAEASPAAATAAASASPAASPVKKARKKKAAAAASATPAASPAN